MSNFMRDFADKSYLKGLTQAARNNIRVQQTIDQMGNKYLCHSSNQVKRLTRKRFIR